MQRSLVSLYSLSNARIGSRRCEVMDPAKTRSNFRLPNAARAHFIDINQLTCDTRPPHPAGKLERTGDVLDGKPLLVSNGLASRLPLRETVVKQHFSDIIVTVDDYSVPQIDGIIPVIFRCLLLQIQPYLQSK